MLTYKAQNGPLTLWHLSHPALHSETLVGVGLQPLVSGGMNFHWLSKQPRALSLQTKTKDLPFHQALMDQWLRC